MFHLHLFSLSLCLSLPLSIRKVDDIREVVVRVKKEEEARELVELDELLQRKREL